MKQELTQRRRHRRIGWRASGAMVGIEWIDFKAAAPSFGDMVTEPPANVEVKRERARRLLLAQIGPAHAGQHSIVRVFAGAVQCVLPELLWWPGFRIAERKTEFSWEQMRRLTCQLRVGRLYSRRD
jgi:hypothetical protein